MLRLYPLSLLTSESALYLIDLHLRSSSRNLLKILSDAQIQSVGLGKVSIKTTAKDEDEYWIGGMQLLPPSAKISPWSMWASKSFYNMWWLIDYHFAIAAEYIKRFSGCLLPESARLSNWITHGLGKHTHKPNLATVDFDSMPVFLPKEFLKDLKVKNEGNLRKLKPIEIYREFYMDMKTKSLVRMKWTGMSNPTWINVPI